eukprot:1159878-Pelagomonas_calceolata.AAC.15
MDAVHHVHERAIAAEMALQEVLTKNPFGSTLSALQATQDNRFDKVRLPGDGRLRAGKTAFCHLENECFQWSEARSGFLFEAKLAVAVIQRAVQMLELEKGQVPRTGLLLFTFKTCTQCAMPFPALFTCTVLLPYSQRDFYRLTSLLNVALYDTLHSLVIENIEVGARI